ncbi:MAG: hypothetical protein ACJ8AI_14305 [Rhodopila sp.]
MDAGDVVFQGIEILRSYLDYLDITVAGETRRIWLNEAAKAGSAARLRGICFRAPAHSLVAAVKLGYFDAILIGNFMSAELHNVGMYPHITPVIAKLAGPWGVKTFAEWRRFRWRYFRRNPLGYLEWHLAGKVQEALDVARVWADRLHVKRPLKLVYRRFLGDPVT